MEHRMFSGLSRSERAVALRYAEMLAEADRAWLSVGIVAAGGGDAGVTLSDADNVTLTYASLTGGMYFGLSCYLQELLDAPGADTAQIRSSMLGAL